MKIIYTRHAKRRMKWRKISSEEVMTTLQRPELEEPYSLDLNIINAYKRMDRKYLRVSYKRKGEIYVIISVVDKNA